MVELDRYVSGSAKWILIPTKLGLVATN